MEGQERQLVALIGFRVVVAFVLAAFLLLVLPLLVSAQTLTVVINELMWDGTEYVELFNPTADEVSLAGWVVTRQQAGGDVKTVTTFADQDVIAPGAYFLLEKKEEATLAVADRLVPGLTLVNSGELITLTDQDGTIIDQANRLGAWFAGENTTDGVAMERSSFAQSGTVETSWHTSTGFGQGRSGTPGVANSPPKVNRAPEAVLGGATTTLVGTPIVFSAEDSQDDDGDTLTFAWSFGDGSSATGSDVTHTYTAAGNVIVRVTVSDGQAEDEAELPVSVVAPTYSSAMVINEFLPNPVGSDVDGEFIELKNTGSSLVELTGWQLDDRDGGSSPYTISGGISLAPGEVISFRRLDTGIALNNTGDTVRLLDPAGTVKASFTYAATVPEGQSYNRTAGGDYVLSTTVTAGAANSITEPIDEDEEDEEAGESSSSHGTGAVAGSAIVSVELKDVRDEDVGTMVATEGVVSAPPGVLGDKVLYLAGSGIQVYFHKEDFPSLALGDRIAVTGELTTSLGEHRLKLAQASDITVIGLADKPTPHQVTTGDVDAEMEGSLVIIEGNVTQTSGDTFYVDDGSGEVKVVIKDSTKIDKPTMKKGVDVTIAGVVSRTNSGYRLLPRFQEDVRLGRVAGLTSFPATGLQWLWAAMVAFVVCYLVAQARRAREPLLGG